jgi:hypothetical protein
MFKEIIILILLVAVGVLVYLLYDQYAFQDRYMKDRADYIERMTEQLAVRERNVMEKERCDRELTRIKTIHRNVLQILNSYDSYGESLVSV